MHVLFADDEPSIRNVVEVWFKTANHSIQVVSNGQQAVKAVEREAFDLIVLDIHMPFMDGWQAIERIRQLPNGKSVPIGVLSAVVDRSDLEAALALGADAIFSCKPFDPRVFVAEAEALMNQSRQKQES